VTGPIEFVGRDSGGDGLAHIDEHLGGDSAGDSHGVDLVGGADRARASAIDGWPVAA
jgi:hypothetical protein